MNSVSEMETKQQRYEARRRAGLANLSAIVETPGQEFWMIYRKPEWRADR